MCASDGKEKNMNTEERQELNQKRMEAKQVLEQKWLEAKMQLSQKKMEETDIVKVLRAAGIGYKTHIEFRGLGDKGQDYIQIQESDPGLYEYTIRNTTSFTMQSGTLNSTNLMDAAMSIIRQNEYSIVERIVYFAEFKEDFDSGARLLDAAFAVWEKRDSLVCKELSRQEFETRYPDVSTYEANFQGAVFLSDGALLLNSEWNGYEYNTIAADGTQKSYVPLYLQKDEDNYEIVAYTCSHGIENRFITMADIRESVCKKQAQSSPKKKMRL